MKYVITIGIIMSFGLLFTSSSGILKGEVFAMQEEEQQRNGYYYKDQYSQGYDKDSFYGIDKELLDEIGNKLFEGIDKDLLVNNVLNLLNEYDIVISALEEQLLQDSGSYAGGFVLILVLFILLVIIGAGFGTG
jgi:uncharacterized protein (TIGR01732 family)